MSLGILNNISAIYAGNNLNNTQASLQKVLQQLSSGARINSGADDAAGLAIANGLKANENALTQSVQNASDATGLLNTADGALSQVTNLLNRAVTLATEAANGTLSTAQVSSANQEYQSIISEIGSIGGSTNFNGVNVFSNTSTNFYVGDGTSSGSNIYNDVTGALSITSVGQSAPAAGAVAVAAATLGTAPTTNTALASPTTGITVAGTAGTAGSATYTFANATTDTTSGTLAFSTTTNVTSFSVNFAAGTTIANANTAVQAAITAAGGATATNLTSAVVGNTIVVTSSANGAAIAATSGSAILTALTDTTPVAGKATFVLANATDTIGGTISFTQGLETATTNIAAGSTLAQAVAQLNATGGVFANAGITAAIGGTNNNKLVLTNTNVAVGGSAAQNAAAAAESLVASTAGSTLTDTQVSQALAVPTPTASANNVASTATFASLQNATDTIVGTLKVSVGGGTIVSVALAAGTTLSGAVALLNNNSQVKAAGVLASTNGTKLVLTGPLGTGANSSDLSLTGTVLSDAPASSGPGVGTDFTSATLNTLTTASAQNVLTGVNAAIANVSYQRGILGAYTNQLTAASNTAASENVNLTSAESSIRSTNYGTATSDLAKYEVLSQTGISALAQANSVQQEILKLLQ